jgi:beta-propeller repeat-containing protein
MSLGHRTPATVHFNKSRSETLTYQPENIVPKMRDTTGRTRHSKLTFEDKMRSYAGDTAMSAAISRRLVSSFAVILGLVFSMILTMSSSVAAQGLLWAKRAGGTGSNDVATGTAVDGSGNIYVTGIFQGSATFGLGEANQTTLISAGSDDMFVAQYSSSGVLLWAKRAGGTGLDRGVGIAVDGLGNIYVAGIFQGSATFGLGEANQTTLTSSGGSDDIFVAQYDSSGTLQWAKGAGGTGSDRGAGIAVDGLGNSYVTGWFNGTAMFGQGQANQTTLTSSGGSDDIFVAQYDFNGALQWAKRAGGAGQDQGAGIAVDGSGNSYVTGYFNGSATFAQGQANQTTLTSVGDREMFVAKYDSIGTLLWAKRSGGTGADRGFSIAVDGLGNIYVTGLFQVTATFGQGQANQTTLTSNGSDDIFVAKHDSSGALQWAKRVGDTESDGGLSIVVDGFGNSYATGFFSGSATFGQGQANQTTLTSAGARDIFVAKYDSSGLLQWAKRAGAGGTSIDQGMGIAVDGSGNGYVAGYFNGTATFGQGEANQTTLTSAGGADIYVAKFAGN